MAFANRASTAPNSRSCHRSASRVLRPGSTPATDAALATVTTEWKSEERRLGVEIPPRTWAYLMRTRSDLDAGLVLAGGGGERQRMDAVQSMLWPRGWQLRAEQLNAWNPFAENLPAAPEVLRSLAAAGRSPAPAHRRLREHASGRLWHSTGSAQVLATPDQAARTRGSARGPEYRASGDRIPQCVSAGCGDRPPGERRRRRHPRTGRGVGMRRITTSGRGQTRVLNDLMQNLLVTELLVPVRTTVGAVPLDLGHRRHRQHSGPVQDRPARPPLTKDPPDRGLDRTGSSRDATSAS